jgi:hypothetical protein
MLDRSDAARIDWGEDSTDAPSEAGERDGATVAAVSGT